MTTIAADFNLNFKAATKICSQIIDLEPGTTSCYFRTGLSKAASSSDSAFTARSLTKNYAINQESYSNLNSAAILEVDEC